MKKDIEAIFVNEYGVWSDDELAYINKRERRSTKTIQMVVEDSVRGKVLRFIGGPTGQESFYIHDLMDPTHPYHPKVCVCAGTINSYAQCWVDRKEVVAFIEEELAKDEGTKSD